MQYSFHEGKKRSYRRPIAGFILLACLSMCVVVAYTIMHASVSAQSQSSVAQSGDTDEPLHPAAIPTSMPAASTTSATTNSEHDATIPPVTNGLAPVITTISTKEPVVFLGIDDGANKQPFELELMKTNHVKASLFLAARFIMDNPGFFKDFIPVGSIIEDHTIHHKLLAQLSYDEQKQEICGQANWEAQEYGRRPILLRPPGGDFNKDTQRAAAACGMKAVVMWIAKANGGSMQYQVGHSLRPGDIVLMHFRPEFQKDMGAFLQAQNAAGLHTELLEDWLPAS